MKPGNRFGEKKKKSAIIITNWQSPCINPWMTVLSLSVSVCSMTVWDSVMNFLSRSHSITSWSRKSILSLAWTAIISLSGYRVTMIRRNMTTPFPAYQKSEGWWKKRSLRTLLRLLSHRQAYKLHWWWKRMMAYTSIFMKPLWLITHVCTSIWTTRIWYSNPGWHRMPKETKGICRLPATHLGVRLSWAMTPAISSLHVSLSTWTNHAR